MAHVDSADEWSVTLYLLSGASGKVKVSEFVVDSLEYLTYGVLAQGTLAEHIFMARLGMKFHHSHTGAFLPAVVLFLHEEIKFVKTVSPGPVLLFVILQRLEQAHHSHATLMFENLHNGRKITKFRLTRTNIIRNFVARN